MLGPEDVGLGLLQVFFQGLDLAITFAQHRVEMQVAEPELAHFMAGFLRRFHVALAQCRAQAVARRVARITRMRLLIAVVLEE